MWQWKHTSTVGETRSSTFMKGYPLVGRGASSLLTGRVSGGRGKHCSQLAQLTIVERPWVTIKSKHFPTNCKSLLTSRNGSVCLRGQHLISKVHFRNTNSSSSRSGGAAMSLGTGPALCLSPSPTSLSISLQSEATGNTSNSNSTVVRGDHRAQRGTRLAAAKGIS